MLAAYQILQVAPWSSHHEVKRAYRAKAKEHHPDLHGNPHASDEMVRLNRARQLLLLPADLDVSGTW